MKKYSYQSPKNNFFMIMLALFFLGFPIFQIVVDKRLDKEMLLLIIPALFNIIIIIYGCFKKIYIDKDGVTYCTPSKMHEINWTDIHTICIKKYSIGRGSETFIYFTNKDISYSYYRECVISDDFIMVVFRSSIIRELRKYWNREIEGLS